MPDNFEHTQEGLEQKDNFYDEEYSPDEISLEDALSSPVIEDDSFYEDEEEREDWQLTSDEERELKRLLEKKEQEDHIMKTYRSLESKPEEEEIQDWKTRFGDIFLVSLSEKENYIFRAIKRQEWRQLVAQIQKLPELKKAEAICMKGVLYPKLTDLNIAAMTAGAPETIRNLILEASNFIEPERAITLVRKL